MQIKTIRKRLSMSQSELAEKAGITQAYLSALETGSKTNPSLKTLKSIADVMEVEVVDLIYAKAGAQDAS